MFDPYSTEIKIKRLHIDILRWEYRKCYVDMAEKNRLIFRLGRMIVYKEVEDED